MPNHVVLAPTKVWLPEIELDSQAGSALTSTPPEAAEVEGVCVNGKQGPRATRAAARLTLHLQQ